MGTLYATVTVDWEGEKIAPQNLNLLESFKTQYPNIPLTHFICPAYFTRGADLSREIEKIRALTQHDEVGLHIHCWRSLIAACHVTPRLQPRCQEDHLSVQYRDGEEDTGFTVPLGVYTVAEIRKILRTSRDILVEHDLTTPEACVSFRCGAWLACDAVFSALSQENFLNDASGVSFYWASELIEQIMPTFAAWIRQLWGNCETRDPPYLANTISHRAYPDGVQGCLAPNELTISMPQVLANGIVEIPDTGVLMDYTPQTVLYYYIQQAWRLSKQQDTYISFGFHLESAGTQTVLSNDTPLLIALMQVLSRVTQEGIIIRYLKIHQVKETLAGENRLSASG